MRIRYWTIRATPDPIRILNIGVGVIVMDPETGEVDVKTISGPEDLPSFISHRKGIHRAVSDLATSLRPESTGQPAVESEEPISPYQRILWLRDH